MADIVVSQPGPDAKKLPKAGLFHRLIREITALLFWTYLLLKLFVFDVDVYLMSTYLPEYAWLLKFKFFLIIGLIAAFWLFTKSRFVLIWFLYVTLYPLVIVCWKIPLFVLKQRSWVLAFAIINGVVSFFRSIKYKFISATLFLLAAVIVLVVPEKISLWVAITVIFGLLCAAYIRSILFIFRPSALYEIHAKAVAGLIDAGKNSYSLEKEIKGMAVAQLSDKQLEKWVSGLQFAILYNRGCYFVSKKLRDYQNSKFSFMSYLVNLFFIIVATIFAFALINYGLYKINNTYFDVTRSGFFYFFSYSFSTFTFSGISEIAAVTPVSQLSQMIEKFFALFVGFIFVSHLFSIRSDRYANEMGEVIAVIKKRGDDMGAFIEDEYKLTFEEAMKELERLKGNMLNFIYLLSKGIE